MLYSMNTQSNPTAYPGTMTYIGSLKPAAIQFSYTWTLKVVYQDIVLFSLIYI